jgi:hypothetical protein
LEEPAVPRRFSPLGDPIARRECEALQAAVPVTNGENATFPLSADVRLRPKRHAGVNPGKDHKENFRRMMTARSIVEELIRHVDPPRGTPIVVNEAPSTKADDPNWIEYPAVMDALRRRLLSEKAAELRKSHPLIDWSDGDGTPGLRRVAMWAPEL